MSINNYLAGQEGNIRVWVQPVGSCVGGSKKMLKTFSLHFVSFFVIKY